MDLDRLAREFADLKARVEPMLADWEKYEGRRTGRRAAPEAFDSGVTDENRAEIMKPLTPAPAPVDEKAAQEAELDAQRLKNGGQTDAELAAAKKAAGGAKGGQQGGQKGSGKAPATAAPPQAAGGAPTAEESASTDNAKA